MLTPPVGQWKPEAGAAKKLSKNHPYVVTTSLSSALGLSPDEDLKLLLEEELLFPNFPDQSNEGDFINDMKQNQTASELQPSISFCWCFSSFLFFFF